VINPRAAVAVDAWERREVALRRWPMFDKRNALRLTRELRASGSPLERVWVECLENACDRLGVEPRALRRFLERSWGATKVGRCRDRWHKAADQAGESFGRFRDLLRHRRDAWAAALAFNLGELARGEGWFPFPSARLAEWLRVHRDTADAIVSRLEAAGLIEVRRDKKGRTAYRFKAGDAREVRWVGTSTDTNEATR
jgi:hypothetical protein